MKSLKDKSSPHQISYDYILDIPKQPGITCPIINAMQFSGKRATRTFKTEIDEDPSSLFINTFELTYTVQQLERWAEAVIDYYEDFKSDELKLSELHQESLEECVRDIRLKMDNNKNYEIEERAKEVNEYLYEWERLHEKYNRERDQLENLEKQYSDAQDEISDCDEEDEPERFSELEQTIENLEEDIEDCKKEIENYEDDFRSNVGHHFDREADDFSSFLEIVRNNNDIMRMAATDLKRAIISHSPELLQPMEYLKKQEKGYDNEISLGVITNKDRPFHFEQICNYLKSHDVITSVQAKLLCIDKNKDELFKVLTDLGYSTIYYYDTKEPFLSTPELFKIYNSTELEIQQKPVNRKIGL